MGKEVILIFDVGKTNKKVVLFDRDFRVVHEEETRFEEVSDDEGFPCDDAEKLESWIVGTLHRYLRSRKFTIRGVNFTSYGATLVCLDKQGSRITPVYNYLKPLPRNVLHGFYEPYGGEEEFSRRTASPALGMLNSGIQLLWLKKTRPEVFSRVAHVLHLPQYLSYLATGRITSEHTSLGCHTAMWDFDDMKYHCWLGREGINLPDPRPVAETVTIEVEGRAIKAGIGIHDSSASLAPYILAARDPFILVSTGTWCISMNPFNHEPLTRTELAQDCLCYLSVNRKPVKSSRFFLGHIHDVNVARIEAHFRVGEGAYKGIQPGPGELRDLWERGAGETHFFRNGIPDRGLDTGNDLDRYNSFSDAYGRLMVDLSKLAFRSIGRIIPGDDRTRHIYVSGGFAKNGFFTGFISCAFPGKQAFTSGVENATSLGAALVISGSVWPETGTPLDLGLREVIC